MLFSLYFKGFVVPLWFTRLYFFLAIFRLVYVCTLPRFCEAEFYSSTPPFLYTWTIYLLIACKFFRTHRQSWDNKVVKVAYSPSSTCAFQVE